MQTSIKLTDQELVKRIGQKVLTEGKNAAKIAFLKIKYKDRSQELEKINVLACYIFHADYQNELLLRYMAEEDPVQWNILYEHPDFAYTLYALLKIEYITKTAHDLLDADRKGEITPERVEKMTAQQKIVWQVVNTHRHIDPYRHNWELVLRCWALQTDVEDNNFAGLIERNPDLFRTLYHKFSQPISVTRLRRFAQAAGFARAA